MRITIPLNAGEQVPVAVEGTSVHVLDATDAVELDITFGDGGNRRTELEAGLGVRPETPDGRPRNFTELLVGSETAQTVTLLLEQGGIADNRFVSGTVSVSERGAAGLSTAAHSVGTTAVEIAAAADRRGVLVQAVDGTVYVGGSGVTTGDGIKVAQGGSAEIQTRAAVYAVAASGTVDVRTMEET